MDAAKQSGRKTGHTLMLIAGAIVFLKEKMTARLWIGAILITSGIIIVSATHG